MGKQQNITFPKHSYTNTHNFNHSVKHHKCQNSFFNVLGTVICSVERGKKKVHITNKILTSSEAADKQLL